MQVVLDEARSSYSEEVVVELRSENTDDIEVNVERLVQWVNAWQQNQSADEAQET